MKNNQKHHKLKKQKYSFDQYWSVFFTERLPDGSETDYKTIIKAMSLDLVREILIKKARETDSRIKIKSVQINLLRKNSSINNIRLDLEDWEHVKKCAFPNIADHLFKYIHPRPEGYTNRYNNVTQTNCVKGCVKFKKGQSNRRNNITEEQKSQMQWKNGKWVPWPKSERKAFKNKIILALRMHENNRTYAAEHLGIGHRDLYRIMKKRFPEVDWQKEYPPPKPTFVGKNIDHKAKNEKIKKTHMEKSQKLLESITPKVLSLYKQGYQLTKISEKLGHAKKTIKKVLTANEQ